MAKRLAASGYTVLLPNVFYRTGKPPMFDFVPKMGDERTMKRFGELAGPMNPSAMERDAASYVDFLAASDSVSAGKMGVVGYCFTGAMAMRTAAVRPEKIASAASFHGGGLYTDTPASPHLVLPRIKAELYFGHAINDASMPKEAIEKLDRALASWGGKYESEVYDGASHGWTTADAPVYNRAQAERAFEKLTGLFAKTLK
jgi:carboxymethylenebutenolidase